MVEFFLGEVANHWAMTSVSLVTVFGKRNEEAEPRQDLT